MSPSGPALLLVPFTGGPSHAVTDVATGRVAMIIEGYSGVAGAARSGSIKLIAQRRNRSVARRGLVAKQRAAQSTDLTLKETFKDICATLVGACRTS